MEMVSGAWMYWDIHSITLVNQVHDILQNDWDYPKKQRHSAKQIYKLIQNDGYVGNYTMVQEVVGYGVWIEKRK